MSTPRCPVCFQRVPATHGVLAEHTAPGGTVICSPQVDDETAQTLERLDEQKRAARALADVFCANADAGNDEANTDLMQAMLQRMRVGGRDRDF